LFLKQKVGVEFLEKRKDLKSLGWSVVTGFFDSRRKKDIEELPTDWSKCGGEGPAI